ncbi:hypothetical protein Mapa_009413 [Marchantia paleacea]|nr:hypothetical protein Mapa_009413 [Marchantia paleacea]
MAYQCFLDSTRDELIDVRAPSLEHRMLTGSSSSSLPETVISDEERGQLASSLSACFIKLKQGEDVLGIGRKWSELVDPNFDFDLDEHAMRDLIAYSIRPDVLEDARFVARLFSQGRKVQEGSNEQIQLQNCFTTILRPFASNIPRTQTNVHVYKGPRMKFEFTGEVREIAKRQVADKHPYNGNLSYAPILASHSLVDGMTEVQYGTRSLQTMEQEQLKNYRLAGAFINEVRKKSQRNTDESVVHSLQVLHDFCVQVESSGVDPALLLASILSRKNQIAFSVSALGCGLSVQIPFIDRLTRKILHSLSEAWKDQRSVPKVIVTTGRVDGGVVKNVTGHIKSRGLVEHYTDVIFIYRHTDRTLLFYDYNSIEDKLVFMAAAEHDLTVKELEDVSGAEIYHCSRDDDGKVKEGDAAAHPQGSGFRKIAEHLKLIRKQKDGNVLNASSKCRLHYCQGLLAKLNRHPSQLGCWKHMISGTPPKREDAEKLLEANVIEVLALLTLWYKHLYYFQLSFESVLNSELARSFMPSLTPALGHVAYSSAPDGDERTMYSHVPDPLGERTAFVTAIAHKDHDCWKRRLLWGGPSGRDNFTPA